METYTRLAFQYNTADAAAFRDRYQCCGDGTQNPYNSQCFQLGGQGMRDCTTAVFDRLDFTLMIAGIILIGILVTEIFGVIFGFVLVVNHRYRTLVD
jgi:hypothetical protein